jgi:uncharacterized protein
MAEVIAGFDWDNGNSGKCQKHGLTLKDVEFALSNGPLVAPDIKHSADEERLVSIGKTRDGRYVFVAFTFRIREGAKFIRPISARYMHEKEIRSYEARAKI